MLQQESAEDYVIATGVSHSVREFVIAAFKHIGVEIVYVCVLVCFPVCVIGAQPGDNILTLSWRVSGWSDYCKVALPWDDCDDDDNSSISDDGNDYTTVVMDDYDNDYDHVDYTSMIMITVKIWRCW